MSLLSGFFVPKYYYVPRNQIEEEHRKPGSAVRKPNDDPDIFLHGQALYILIKLLGKLITVIRCIVDLLNLLLPENYKLGWNRI